jgi:folate-binding protein YgfZ
MDLPFASRDLSAGEAEAFRLRDGIPAVPLDIPPGGLNPIEARLESPLSFTKGCYLGQEVVARVHRLQRFRQRLVRIDSYDTEIVPGRSLQLEGKEVGSVTSVARSGQGWLGMARLRSSVPAGKHDFEGVEITVQELEAS